MTQHIDPRILDILRRRAEQAITIVRTEAPRLRPQGVPSLDAPATETPMSDGELGLALALVLPRIDALVRRAITDIRSDGRLTWAEALALAPELRNIVSLVIAEVLPDIKGTSAYDLVALVTATLIAQYVAPRLPAALRPYLTAQAIRTAIKGLQFAYDNWVRPRLQKAPTP